MAIAWIGSLYLTIITTTRKIFSVLFSIVIFGYSLNQGQNMGVVLVVFGITCELGYNIKKKLDSEKKKQDIEKRKVKSS